MSHRASSSLDGFSLLGSASVVPVLSPGFPAAAVACSPSGSLSRSGGALGGLCVQQRFCTVPVLAPGGRVEVLPIPLSEAAP